MELGCWCLELISQRVENRADIVIAPSSNAA